ncbi:hypothetical protein [Nostoc sp. DedVER02]|uniref:hypothetical protein n=2 Tax=unclassified Nostoc TaxID=2593658 RepID=UPI002AD3934D|nr:hypothetical protein [Nostoc sp. DedVER02]MDZ8111019.1 hypothetical protein [Nostoc sp. DedVER01b]
MSTAIGRAYKLFLKGYSLRKIAKIFKIPKSTLSYKFRKLYGSDYAEQRNHWGILQVIQEYANDKSLSPRDRQQIRDWMNRNFNQIIESERANLDKPLYTNRKLQQLTELECSYRKGDWKRLFEDTLISSY